MNNSKYTITLYSNNIDFDTTRKWFKSNGFSLIKFKNGRFQALFSDIGHIIEENENFDTYYKEDVGGSLLVFEIRHFRRGLECICYSPITLFGFYKMKISFKKRSSWITKYRQHGYEYLTDLKKFISQQ